MSLLKNFGPAIDPDGNELLMLDTLRAGNGFPQNVSMGALQVSGTQIGNLKNLIIGGDFSANPWQRGTSIGSITNTLTYTADRWAAVSGTAGASITVSRQSDTTTPGVQHGLRFQRASGNTNTSPHRLVQVLESAVALRAQGRRVALSFRAFHGANFSPVGGTLNVVVATGTGTDESATSFVAGTWAGYTALPTFVPVGATTQIPGPNANTISGLEGGFGLIPASSVALLPREQYFQMVFDVPFNATQLGVMFVMNPVGTAGANDWYQIKDVQLEVVSTTQPFSSMFTRRSAVEERLLALRYFWRLNEPETAAAVVANGMISATNAQTILIPTLVPMRVPPTVTVVAGTWRFNIAGTLTAVAGFAGGAAATQTTTAINVVGTVTATAGQATQLVSGASGFGGQINANSEL
jgi:hypothetical protein